MRTARHADGLRFVRQAHAGALVQALNTERGAVRDQLGRQRTLPRQPVAQRRRRVDAKDMAQPHGTAQRRCPHRTGHPPRLRGSTALRCALERGALGRRTLHRAAPST
jgi:hypothetical protein